MDNYEYIDSTGVIVPDTSTILTGVQTEYQTAFGADLIVTADTPQGVLINAEALARTQVVNNNAAVANQINPNIAGGIFLDAIGFMTGIQRTAAQPTTVFNVNVTGAAGTVIPAASQAQTAAGDIFITTTNVTIGAGGTATVNFESAVDGPIPCAEGALDMIVSNVLGWETVTNPTAGTLGVITESDQQFRAYRQNTLGFQGVALPIAITSALYATDGVQSLYFQENVTDQTQVINGITMISHSIWACVNGGTDLAVAAALLENKSSGCGWNGETVVDVVEPASGQTYTVAFDRPSTLPIYVKVTSQNGNSTDIVNAILDYAAGLVQTVDQNGVTNIYPGFVVGGDVSPFEIAAAINAENPGIYISNLGISLTNSAWAPTPIEIAVNQIPVIQASYITVVSA